MTRAMPFADIEDGRALAQAIVDTVREPLLVLNNLRVVAASRSFYLTFRVNQQELQGQLLYPYLSKLCATLANSMIGEKRSVSVEVSAEEGTASSSEAVSIGLIVTEGMINALKHAFPPDKKDGRIVVTYKVNGLDWKFSIADNGMGEANQGPGAVAKTGLGTTIVDAGLAPAALSMPGLIWSLDRRAQ